MTRIDRTIIAALLAGTWLVPALAVEPGDKRTGAVEVTVTYTGQGAWRRNLEHGTRSFDRKLTYRMPIIGYYGPASGWKEIDDRLPTPTIGPIPEQKATKADMADLSAAFEAADEACGEDEDCLVTAMMGKAKAMQAAGKIEVPKQMPKATNMPDFTRFVSFGPDCGKAVATTSVNDRYDDTRIEGSEGSGGLRRHTYTIGGTGTLRGDESSAQHCRFSLVLDTRANSYSLFVPIQGRGAASNGATGQADGQGVDFTATLGSQALTKRVDARTRWLDLKLPAGGKVLAGQRVLEDVGGAGPDGTPIRAVVDWKVILN